MTIHIEELTVDTIIGILDFERSSKQKVVIETRINYIYTENQFINYALVIKDIEKSLHENEYKLLENALSDISRVLFENYSQIESLYLKISKPNIIKNATVSVSNEWNNASKHQRI
jgi:dihydroneopterin aldolase